MNSLIWRRLPRLAKHCVVLVACLACSPLAAQVRVKKPDRDTYQAPVRGGGSAMTSDWELYPDASSELSRIQIDEVVYDDVEASADAGGNGLQVLEEPSGLKLRTLGATTGSNAQSASAQIVRPVSAMSIDRDANAGGASMRPARVIRKTSGTVTVMEHPTFSGETIIGSGTPMALHGPGCGLEGPGCGVEGCGCGFDVSCGLEGPGCGLESYGCDSCGYGGCDGLCGSGGAICVDPNRWFGSAELMIMFRKGDRLPPLVTTDTSPNTGSLDTGTVLAGNDSVLKDAAAGGRLTLGLWLDRHQCRSLVFRGWVAGDENYSFGADQRNFDVLAIPFFNVATDAEDSNVVVFPNAPADPAINGRFGAVGVNAYSELHGGDISVRQFWRGGLGTTFDVLYGYQYMRLSEGLNIASSSTLTEGADAGNYISIRDSFEATSEFHGAQFGLAGRYREGCWSFNWLAKAAFGNVRRTADRQGSTTVGPPDTPQDGGLFVDADTNEGTFTSDTFGWVPELDVNLGWHRFDHFDVTVGYHLMAMTDAIQVSGIFDRNINDPNNVLPSPAMRDSTFYVQGIHFGLSYTH
ncbi:BBP7 family outer membrane beta-barrel protein [Rhodopirellula sp. P2]|uniref:BBP7 family outer membrane beta-barrel protein n=1 Tax=Rhodopirellula sp. P2 TaxID=2127060 RepID=UPI00236801E1|nr:BBP7 family outer membrane beta-barrel protein [Rhodopirellula sp. P2]WDQ16207.1 BBP7 family outer membrane beta-barrel protein [Rhodopirellula sp. P2]